jgi:CubicO group peptidase (beta-lactamase class C family)
MGLRPSAWIKAAKSSTFMGSVLVARGDNVLLSKGYGFANAEWQIPNSPSTKFRLGSITKQFTAAAILILEDRGKLRTSDRVRKYLPDAPAAWESTPTTFPSTADKSIADSTIPGPRRHRA